MKIEYMANHYGVCAPWRQPDSILTCLGLRYSQTPVALCRICAQTLQNINARNPS